MTPDNVSRETLDRLTTYHDLLIKWNPKINLVSKSSISDIWNRHIWDSAQIVPFASEGTSWLDIGSGGGFPGLVVAIYAKELQPDRKVTMVESDQRKTAFLRTVIRELGLNAEVLAKRVEAMDAFAADVLSARALADLDALLGFADRHLSTSGTAFFLKGEKWEKEVQIARESWSFDLRAHKSKTSPTAAILEIKEIQRV
ncbi:MAG: 16S rRNA (guanine(527)-N(7))-methyltransferase RsmG [Roseobacter sp.]